MRKNKTNILLHCAFVALHLYYYNYGELPELNQLEKLDELIILSENYYTILRKQFEDHLKVKEKRKPVLVDFDKDYLIKIFR